MKTSSVRNRFTALIFFFFLAGMLLCNDLVPVVAEPYGYLITNETPCTLWWAEGIYKIKKNDPVPKNIKSEVVISSAVNEYESFQIVLQPKQRMDNVRIEVTEIIGITGYHITPENIKIYHVGYVPVTVPTDTAGRAGDWPDPLIPYDGPFTIYPGENHPIWITVYSPIGTSWAGYEGTITVTSGTWKYEIPLRLSMRSFTLPEETHVKSAFGFWTENLKSYHNLETKEELEKVIDLYCQNFKEHRIAPYMHDVHHPIRSSFDGIYWTGGVFVNNPVFEGKRSAKVEDESVSNDSELKYNEKIKIDHGTPYYLSWTAKTDTMNQQYTVLVQGFNPEGKLLPGRTRLKVFKGKTVWAQDSLLFASGFDSEVHSISVSFLPAFRTESGERKGTAYFDKIALTSGNSKDNILLNGDFEANVESISVNCNFDDFDEGMQKYINVFKFNAFQLNLGGITGAFGGFPVDTPEYEKLFASYLQQIQAHLEEKGWLGKEYIYWFDEPKEDEYDFVKKGMERIHRAAPKLKRFLTEQPEPALYNDVDIWCLLFDYYKPELCAQRQAAGQDIWWYLCTGPKAPWVTLFIDHADINLRMWLWFTFKFKVQGILVWNAMYWNSTTVFPPGVLQNPYEDPMSYRVGYGMPYGQVRNWGNGDGRFVYPPNRDPNNDKKKYICGPNNSIRWEMLREGIEDYEYLWLLENAIKNAKPDQAELVAQAKKLLDFPQSFIKNGKEYTKDPQAIFQLRDKIGDLLDKLIPEFY